jgi:hypothetical protein
MGAQFKVWGLIDALIALFGTRSVKARRSRLPDPYYPQVLQEETRGLRDLLWINTALDLVYIAGGILLVLFRGRSESRWRGHGFGIIIQGAFLFLFDFRKARQLR